MRKLLEIEFNDDYKKSIFVQYTMSILIFSLFLMTRSIDRSFLDLNFFLEGFFLFLVLKFYRQAHKDKNYALWGLTIIISLYLIKHILYFTFIDYNIFILYFSFLAGLFLFMNSYIMSSPLYYPRIQWWEYDFRFSGELKANARVDETTFEARMADLRRNAASILSFEILPLDTEISVEIPYKEKMYEISGIVKTSRELIPGRPIHYGVILDEKTEHQKQSVLKLKKIWKHHNRANLRRKFKARKEEHGV
jgi:hypothetical protein